MMALVDMGCADMAVNFHQTSIQPFHITNFLFIGQDARTCQFMESYSIQCYVYKADKAAGRSSLYRSVDFLRKMNIRTYMIIDALNLGYHVLHTDVDMTFMRNPFAHFRFDRQFDVAPLWDMGGWNAGFIFVRNTPGALKLYEESRKITEKSPKVDDQQSLNMAIKSMKKKGILTMIGLDDKKFVCGRRFWESGQREFDTDAACSECVVIHDNWIVSMEAKRYRLREMHFWMYDGSQRYYTHPDRKYLTFDIAVPEKKIDSKKLWQLQVDSLKTALAMGAILNRTVILPQFLCEKNKKLERCSLLSISYLKLLEPHFKDAFRESSFLRHKLVPQSTKNSKSPQHLIKSSTFSQFYPDAAQTGEYTVHEPLSSSGATPREVLQWFDAHTHKVLVFKSLFGAMSSSSYQMAPLSGEFAAKLKAAIASHGGDYRQYDKPVKKT